MSSFLDSTGLSRVISKITDYFAKKDGTYPDMTVGGANRISMPIGSNTVTSEDKTYQLIARFRSDPYARFSLKLLVGGETGRACSILFITVERNTNTAGLPSIAVSKVGNRSYAGGGIQYGLEYTFDSNNYLYLYGVTYAGIPMNPILLDDISKTPTLMKLYSRTDTITAPSNTTSITIGVPVSAQLDTQVGSPTTPVYVKSDGSVDECTTANMTVGTARNYDTTTGTIQAAFNGKATKFTLPSSGSASRYTKLGTLAASNSGEQSSLTFICSCADNIGENIADTYLVEYINRGNRKLVVQTLLSPKENSSSRWCKFGYIPNGNGSIDIVVYLPEFSVDGDIVFLKRDSQFTFSYTGQVDGTNFVPGTRYAVAVNQVQ